MSLLIDNALPANSPPSFHLLAKPSGATCNIDCKYCFFLSKEALYPNDKRRMMTQLLQQRRPRSDVMALTAAEDDQRGQYQPCPCGSGQKFRFCHGNKAPISPFSGVNPAPDTPQDGRVMPVHAASPQTVSGTAHGAGR